jgi:diacylglycerol kinase
MLNWLTERKFNVFDVVCLVVISSLAAEVSGWFILLLFPAMVISVILEMLNKGYKNG